MGRYAQATCGEPSCAPHYLSGSLDEIRIWNIARSQQEIQAAMNSCLAGDESGLVGYWRLDETSGQLIIDSSPSGNHGTLGANDAVGADDPARSLSFAPVSCTDSDGDGFFGDDCDYQDPDTYPGAPQVCDGVNNDCDAPGWPSLDGTNDGDDDGDSYSECQGDCADASSITYPGAPQVCDGINNDCNAPGWPSLAGTNEADDDGDVQSECAGDCDDALPSVYSGALQICDGVNNDCTDPAWPSTPSNEADGDADGFRICQGDCDDANGLRNPGVTETCNGTDDDCDTLIDDDQNGEDSDGDGLRNLCDNCTAAINPNQLDTDADGLGNSCDNCTTVVNPDQTDQDLDDRGNACDNCPADYNQYQDDYDGDAVGDACDNCFFDHNPGQSDLDADFEGDRCDLDDGLIYVFFTTPDYVEWQEELGYDSWNSYKGDLDVLKASGLYTQEPGSNGLARRDCGLGYPWSEDFTPPPSGKAAHFLTTGVSAGAEGSLGRNSAGNERPNANPFP
jgi:hypothetical protein